MNRATQSVPAPDASARRRLAASTFARGGEGFVAIRAAVARLVSAHADAFDPAALDELEHEALLAALSSAAFDALALHLPPARALLALHDPEAVALAAFACAAERRTRRSWLDAWLGERLQALAPRLDALAELLAAGSEEPDAGEEARP